MQQVEWPRQEQKPHIPSQRGGALTGLHPEEMGGT
jgi:hypothetical protein